jgi:hypothetical protein
MATGASSPLPPAVRVEDFALQSPPPPSPHSTKKDVLSSPPAPPLMHPQPTLSPPHDYNFSSTIYDESSAPTTDHEDAYATTDDETARLAAGAETTSSRSSISSLPASVVVPPPDKPVTPTRSPPGFGHLRSGSGLRSMARRDAALQDRGPDVTPFRHPSSVRAMQMRDEFDDDHDLTPGHRRCGSRMSVGRLSAFSAQSSNSTTTSPSKRGGPRSGPSSPQKTGSKLRKEFPLVLLHCSLLPPTLGLNIKMPESWWLKEVLPEEYWKRWKTLEEKVLGNGEVRTRGVLIPHPKADYDLLEERLLESLELERPRVRSGHFLGAQREEVEGAEDESEAESTQSSQCPDCGRKVPTDVEMERKWEIKVYAANGLMRAGAWGAAWGEMEKVDVEVGVWMPAEVRRDVEARLLDIGFNGLEEEDTIRGETEESEEERRRREIYGSPAPDTQEKIDGLCDDEYHDRRPERGDHHHIHPTPGQHPPPVDLQALILNYLRALAQDRRNVAIAFLTILVLFYAMTSPASRGASSDSFPPSVPPDITTSTITTTATSTTRPDCALDPSTSYLECISALTSTSASECASVTGSASSQASSTIKGTPPTAAAAIGSSDESQPVARPVVAALVQEEVPVARIMMEAPDHVACT